MPNVMDFESPPPPDAGASGFRKDIGLKDDDILILQPTRVVQRKGIEPCGFDVLLMDGDLTDAVVSQVREITSDVKHRSRMVEHNYDIARQFSSYDRVESELLAILNKPRMALTFAP